MCVGTDRAKGGKLLVGVVRVLGADVKEKECRPPLGRGGLGGTKKPGRLGHWFSDDGRIVSLMRETAGMNVRVSVGGISTEGLRRLNDAEQCDQRKNLKEKNKSPSLRGENVER